MQKGLLKTFGEHIREHRIKRDLSQEDLADLTGFHRTYIGFIERGERNLSLLNVEKFAKAFGITLSDLFKSFQ